MKKIDAIAAALNTINDTYGQRKNETINKAERTATETLQKHMELLTVDINAAEFDIDLRRVIQTVDIPEGKRGNLAKYAEKTCYVIVMGIKRGSPRVMFYICEA